MIDEAQSKRARQRKTTKETIKEILEQLKGNQIINDYKINSVPSIISEEVSNIIEDKVKELKILNKNNRDVKKKTIEELSDIAKKKIEELLPIDINIVGIIIGADKKRYALFSNSAQMGERIRQLLWDAHSIKQYNIADFCIFLHQQGEASDDVYEKNFDANKKAFNDYMSISHSINSLDEVLSDEEFYWKFANIFINEKDRNNDDSGDARGKAYENCLALVFKNKSNWKRWNDKSTNGGFIYKTFNKCMTKFTEGRANGEIDNIEVLVGNEIKELLPSSNPEALNRKRKPKTDICIKIRYKNENDYNLYTVSAKCSAAETVSAHEYSVYDYMEALDLGESDNALINVLEKFQKNGSYKGMSKEEINDFKEGLKRHKEALYRWIIKGECVNSDRYPYITDPDEQIAEYLVCYNHKTKETIIHTAQEYISFLLTKKLEKEIIQGCQ